jgi:DNA polymerase III sliding clamp (beta) subunit (PCNA family)
MKKDTITEEKAKNSPAGGVLVGKREGQTIIHDKGTQGGYFVGKLHKEGGIKGINKSTGQPIEVQGGEVIITAPAVADQTKREFEGQMLTNREILSKINEKGGGVSLENGGEIYYNGSSYNYGGKTMTDYEIMQSMNDCGCEDEYDDGGSLSKGKKIEWLKNIADEGWSSTMENKNAYENVGGYISSSKKWKIYREGRWYYDKINGQDSFIRDGDWLVYHNDEFYGNFDSLKEAKIYVENWVRIRPEDYSFGGKTMTDYEIMQEISNCGCEHEYDNGGQMNLAEKSKKGDHPSRDFNNYNDVLDMEADGVVGVENGLAFDEGGFMADVYAGGGQTLSAEVFEWDKVPTNYRNISKVKKVPFTNNPMDKGLDSIIAPFLGKDELRQSMMGVNFDENGITATNAFVLITLPYPNEKYNGIYDINKAKKTKSNDLILIDENYAKYQNIIPNYKDAGTPYLVDVYKLLQYTKTAMNYANKTTYAIAFKYGDNQRIGFNGKLLVEVLTTALKLGHEKIYVFIQESKRAIVLSPNKNYELGNDDILLTMPVMLEANGVSYIEKYGTNDPDYNRSLKAYFDFNDSEIHNADGSVAEFKMQYESNLSVDDKYLTLLSKITSKYNKLPICDYAKVEDGKMTATDLDISLIIKDVNMPNGMYEIVNKAPNITMYPIEDFPKERVFDKSEYETHWKEKRQTAFEFVTFSEVFEFYLDKLLLSVGKDDLRPVMSGICIKKTINNELFLVTTNAHTLCKINITDFCDFDKDDRELEYILPTKYLKDFIKLADGSLHFKCNLTNVFIESDNLEYIARAIDGKYPNYEAVIPKQNDKMIVFDHAQMNKCLKSPEVANQMAKYKGNKDVFFTLSNEGNNLFLKVTKEIRFNVEYQLVDKIKLCEIEFNYEQVDTNIGLDKSVFLLMPSKDEFKENQYFSFRKEFFDVMLETITDTEVECYFTEPNRAYIFPIDAIDYKKTLPDEKTKQQKLSKKDLEQISELEDLKDVLEPIADEEPTFEEIIDLGNNFEIKVEKVFYESGDSTYGAMIFYKNELFKYFVTISNTTKKQAIDNVYKYLKTLRVSDKILENAPKKGEFTVFYNDRGGEHRRIEYSKAEIQQFIFDVKSVTKAEIVPAIENKKYVIESKGFREGIGSSSYKQKREKQKDDIKNQIEKIELQEAIETLEMLIETAKGKDKKDIKEALEILKMLNENN